MVEIDVRRRVDRRARQEPHRGRAEAPAPEGLVHQLEGELNLFYLNENGRQDVALLKTGDLFLLPAKVPHSPRRGDGSWTFVIERRLYSPVPLTGPWLNSQVWLVCRKR